MAQIHTITPKHTTRRKQRVGRGGKRGTFSGRGVKGQKSRSGARIRPEIRDLIKSLPKLRGVGAASGTGSAKAPVKTITLAQLGVFDEGASVSMRTLMKKGFVATTTQRVKIVATGTAPKKLHIVGVPISKGAAKKIAEQGGNVESA